MSNSPLVSYTRLSPNHSGPRTHSIDRITPHCVVGQCSVERLGEIFAPTAKQASCQYGIGSDGRVGMYCEEANRSWCSSSNANDQRAVTIECASDTTHPYAMNNAVYNTLVKLCVDICQRNGKKKLLWIEDKDQALAYGPKADEMLLTVHRWFANKSCPGEWLYSRLGNLAKEVTEQLNPAEPVATYPECPFLISTNGIDYYSVPNGKVNGNTGKGTFTITSVSGNWGKLKSGVGWIYLPDVTISQKTKKTVDELAREVIAGKWGNGITRKIRLAAAGYSYQAVQARVNELMRG